MEHKALLVLDEDEGLLITDDDDPKRVCQDEQTALVELKQDGWSVEVGPSALHAEVPGAPVRRVRGYVLRWSVH
jgi:hypothetical protein